MKKPYIVCHMMTAVDGRIDCAMTEHLPGVQEYYDTLDALNAPSRVSGRVTAQLEMALPGTFESETKTPLGKEGFSKAADAAGYEIVADTRGTLLWDETAGDERPLLILTSERVSREYLAYLDQKHISWIACGAERIDLARACEILAGEFGVGKNGRRRRRTHQRGVSGGGPSGRGQHPHRRGHRRPRRGLAALPRGAVTKKANLPFIGRFAFLYLEGAPPSRSILRSVSSRMA